MQSDATITGKNKSNKIKLKVLKFYYCILLRSVGISDTIGNDPALISFIIHSLFSGEMAISIAESHSARECREVFL